MFPRPDARLVALLVVYLGLTGLYVATVPLWTAPDEIAHYLYVEYVRDHGESPPRVPQLDRLLESVEEERRYLRESKEPPLFYWLGAALLRAFEGRGGDFRWFGYPTGSDAQALPAGYVARLDEVSPDHAGPLAIRASSVLVGALAVYLTWALALALLGDRNVALAAAGFVAFLPEFELLSSAINNDTLSLLFSALATLGLASWLRAEAALAWRPIGVAVLATGLALASKLTAVILVPIFLWVAAVKMRLRHPGLVVFALGVLAVAAWWAVWHVALRHIGWPFLAEIHAWLFAADYLDPSLHEGKAEAFLSMRWGAFGYGHNVPIGTIPSAIYDIASIAGVAGFALRFRAAGEARRHLALIPVAGVAAILVLTKVLVSSFWPVQPRFGYAVLPLFAVMVAAGFQHLLAARDRPRVAWLCFAFFAASALCLFGDVRPRLARILASPLPSAATEADRRTNVVLISLDASRRDVLSAYGHRPEHAPDLDTSPNLDRVASAGVLMLDAYAPSSWTLPSHVSIFTGQPALVHGVDLGQQRLDASQPTLAGALGRHGYRSAGFFSGPYLEPHFGVGRGFDEYKACYGDARRAESLRSAAQAASRSLGEARSPDERADRFEQDKRAQQTLDHFAHRDVSSESVTDAVLQALDRFAAGDEPFFLFAHYFDPHFDFVPPAPWDSRFDPDYDGEMDGTDFYSRPDVAGPATDRRAARPRVVSERDLEHIRALYAGELAWTDAEIGRVLARLALLGIEDETLVIVTADHGGEFFEHGSIGHHRTLFEEVIRVPLLLRLPGVLPSGQRVSGVVSTGDIFPTVLDLLGLPAEPGLTGRSFLPLIEDRQDPTERDVLSRLVTTHSFSVPVGSEPIPHLLIHVLESYRHGSIKITREVNRVRREARVDPALARALATHLGERFPRETLRWIDLARFPSEPEGAHSSDFGDPHASAALRRFQARYEELSSARRRSEAATPDAGTLEALRSLGYVDPSTPSSPTPSEELALPPPGLE